MNNTLLTRLLWKEFRTQRGFWLVVAAAAVAVQLIVLLVIDSRQGTADRTEALYAIAAMFPVFFALGSTAMAFALEKEEQTWNRLRILAVSPGRLLAAKFGFGLAGTIAMLLALLLFALAFSLGEIPAIHVSQSALQYGFSGLFWLLAIVEFLLWGSFFSLLTRRVLSAVLLTPVAVIVIAGLAGYADQYLVAVRLLPAGLLAVVNIVLVRRWLQSESFGLALPGFIALRRDKTAALSDIDTAPPERRLFQRLLWQERQHAKTFVLALLFLGSLLAFCSAWWARDLNFLVVYVILPSIPLFCGISSFRGEQEQQRFRFLVEQGVTPQTIWRAKHVIWVSITISFVLLFVLLKIQVEVLLGSHDGSHSIWELLVKKPGTSREIDLTWELAIVWVCLAYAAGQFTSILFSRGITAAFLGVVLLGGLSGWLALMVWLGAPLLLAVWPIPLVLMWATYRHASDWMLERRGLRTLLPLAARLLVPAVLIIAALAYYRSVIEIASARNVLRDSYGVVGRMQLDKMDAIFAGALQPPPAEALETAAMYRRTPILEPDLPYLTVEARRREEAATLRQQQSSLPEVGSRRNYSAPQPDKAWPENSIFEEWLQQNQPAVEALLQATARESCVFLELQDHIRSGGLRRQQSISTLLLFSARKLESENRLDEALERYIALIRFSRHLAHPSHGFAGQDDAFRQQLAVFHWMPLWIAHPQQTPERLKRAIDLVQTETEKIPLPSEAVFVDYARIQKLYTDPPQEFLDRNANKEWLLVSRAFPWERRRAAELLELLAVEEFHHLSRIEERMEINRGLDVNRWLEETERFPYRKNQPYLEELKEKTPILGPFIDYPFYRDYHPRNWISVNSHRNALLVLMAITGHRLEHGELPARLDRLTPDYFDQLPLELWSGDEFEYYPHGLPGPLITGRNTKLEPGTPFLYSGERLGGRIIRAGTIGDLPRFRDVPSGGWSYPNVEEHDGELVGRIFLIPETPE